MSTFPATADFPVPPVARWLQDEPSGNALAETGGIDLTDVNTVGAGVGFTDVGATFDNARDLERDQKEHFSAADNALFDIVGDLSFAALLNIETAPGTGEDYAIMSKFDIDSDNKSYLFRYDENGGNLRLSFFITDTGATPATGGSINQILTTGTFFLVGFAYNASAGTADIYVNGVSIGTLSSMDTSIFSGNSTFRLGQVTASSDQSAAGSAFDGRMNDSSLYNQELSAAQFLTLYELYTVAAAAAGRANSFFI